MKGTWFFLIGACAVLTILWLPGIVYPVVSDTVHYALLGRDLWTHGTYTLRGVPYANHLPLHAFLSYPLTQLFGFHMGMHVASLDGGFGVLIAAFFLAKKIFNERIAMLTCIALLLYPAFVLMTMLGSADLLFTVLFLASLLFFLKADEDRRWYLLAGILAGLASLTRYNGLPLFALFALWVAWKRRFDLRDRWFWSGMCVGLLLASLWFIRNAVTFGDPFFSNYRAELVQEAPNPLWQLLRNIRYYANPLHNIFPFLFPFALVGLWRHGRKQPFLVLAMLAGIGLSMIWWVQAIRFLFPGFVILLIFAVLGLLDVFAYFRRSSLIVTALIVAGIAMQSFSLCMYTYGACNAAFDGAVGILPKNLGLTPEGFYAWHKAREWLNANAMPGATVYYELAEESDDIFRSDLKVTSDTTACPAYRITQRPQLNDDILHQTDVWPVTSVVKHPCTPSMR